MRLTFIQTPEFAKQAEKLLSEESLRFLENELLKNPEAGKVIAGTGGVRKVRFAQQGSGKRSGLRILYLLRAPNLYWLWMYPTSTTKDISPAQKKILAQIAKELK